MPFVLIQFSDVHFYFLTGHLAHLLVSVALKEEPIDALFIWAIKLEQEM